MPTPTDTEDLAVLRSTRSALLNASLLADLPIEEMEMFEQAIRESVTKLGYTADVVAKTCGLTPERVQFIVNRTGKTVAS